MSQSLDQKIRRCMSGRGRPRWLRRVGYWLWWLSHDGDAPEFVARGIGVGIFAGVLPTLGQSFVAIFLAWAFRGSKMIAALMTFLSNPFTTLPIFAFDYWMGSIVLNKPMLAISSETFESWESFSQHGPEFVFTIFTGGTIVGLVTGIVSYLSARVYIDYVRNQRSKRRLARAYPHIVLKDDKRHDSNLG